MNHGMKYTAFFCLLLTLAGCSESNGIPYSSLSATEQDQDINAAKLRWDRILEEAAISPADIKEQNAETPTSTDSANNQPTKELPNSDADNETNEPKASLIALDRSDEEVFEIEPREPKLLIPQKSFFKDRRSGTLRVSYDDIDLLKILNMEPVPADAADMFPDWLNNLNGQRIRIRGWMIPPPLETGLKRFSLARDNGICCFIRQPKVYDVLQVTMRDGETADFISGRPFDVEGVLKIDPVIEDDELYELYFLEDALIVER